MGNILIIVSKFKKTFILKLWIVMVANLLWPLSALMIISYNDYININLSENLFSSE